MKPITTKEELHELFKADEGRVPLNLNEIMISNMTIAPDDVIKAKSIQQIAHSKFYHNVIFKDLQMSWAHIDSVTFGDIKFENCEFKNTTFAHCDFESSVFENCRFDEVHFAHSNFLCSNFKCCTFDAAVFRNGITDSNISLTKFDSDDDTVPDTFLDHCIFNNLFLIMRSSIKLTGDADLSLISDIEDLKKIEFKYVPTVVGSKFNPEIVTIGPIGSRHDYTTYIPSIDWVQCGCWTDEKDNPDKDFFPGGHLDAFEERVKHQYPYGKYHDQYMAAIQIFKVYKNNLKVPAEIVSKI